MTDLLFLPQPVEICMEDGEFVLSRKATLVLPASADDDDLFAVQWLLGEMEASIGTELPLVKRYAPDHPGTSVILARADRDAAWLSSFAVPSLPAQGYYLRVTPEDILLVGADAAGLFYAVQTFSQLLDQTGRKLPALAIIDYPALPVRGLMLDVSRGKVPTLEAVMELVDHLASWKMNQFQLYIEHTFAWPSHPKIGEGYDPLTPEDIIAIDAACAKRHIDFVPNLQSFGHQGHLLRLRKYARLAESDKKWTLSPAESDTYTLLDELYAEFLPNFRSPLFNVDSDETWDLGTGKSKALVEEFGTGRVYLNHILQLRDLAEKYGSKIMFWGDIILHTPELIPDIPDDVIVLQWDYSRTPNEENVRKFAEAGKPFYVCPGTNTWSAFTPRLADARGNIGTMAAYGKKYGARGMLNTDWGDGGHYNLQGLSYYAYAFGAAEGWNPGHTARFDEAFGHFFFGVGWESMMDAIHTLERVTEPLPGQRIWDAPSLHHGFLTGTDYREKITPQAAAIITKSAREALALLKRLHGRTHQPLVVEEWSIAAVQDLLLGEKAQLAVDFHIRYTEIRENNDLEGLEALAREVRPQLRRLANSAADIPALFAPLWLARARESDLELVLAYQMEVATDLQQADAWLANAVTIARKSGQVPELPEKNDHWTPKYWALQMGG